MEIRKVSKENLDTVTTILTGLIDPSNRRSELPSQDYTEKLLADDRTYLLAAYNNDAVVGYTLAYRFPSLYASEFMAYLYDIELLPEHRRKGVGRLLVETLMTHLRADGVKEVWLGTAVDNIEGQALFSSTGATKSEEAFNDYTYYL